MGMVMIPMHMGPADAKRLIELIEHVLGRSRGETDRDPVRAQTAESRVSPGHPHRCRQQGSSQGAGR